VTIMSQLPNEEIEGRLIALREAVSFLIGRLASMESSGAADAGRLLDSMEAHALFQDHQEDPGAVPSGGAFAIEAAAKGEFRRILSDARSLLQETSRRPPSGA